MYFVGKGLIEITRQGTHLVTIGDGSFVGEIALLLDQPRSASAKSLGYSDLYQLNKDDFEHILLKHPKLLGTFKQRTNVSKTLLQIHRFINKLSTGVSMYAVGDTVQDFTLPNQDGEMITLSQYRGKKGIDLVLPQSKHTWMHGRGVLFT